MARIYDSHTKRFSNVKLTPLQRDALKYNKFIQQFPFPRWTDKEELLIDWFKQYVSQRTQSQSIYNSLLQEIEKGPRGPLALSHELQRKLNQVHYLVTGTYKELDQQSSFL
jgi:hypothetical protein